MFTTKCSKCGNVLIERETICLACGTKVKKTVNIYKWPGNMLLAMTITLLVILIFGIIVNLVDSKKQRTSSQSPAQLVNKSAIMSPADHLLTAKKLLQTNFNQAIIHLDAIPKNAPEFAEVASLRKEVIQKQSIQKLQNKITSDDKKLKEAENKIKACRDKLRKYYGTTDDLKDLNQMVVLLAMTKAVYASRKNDTEKRLYSKASSLLPKAQMTLRDTYASSIEEILVRTGMDAQVSALGTSKKTLRITYALMSQPLVYKFQNEVRIDEQAKNVGFSKIVYSNGFQSSLGRTWTVDLK